MHIDSYQFGEIIIDGKTYTSDLIIFSDSVESDWWRKEGHLLQIEDLSGVIEAKPEIIVIGRGASGCMIIASEVKEYLKAHKIKLISQNTNEACQTFNQLYPNSKIVGLFHLTC